MWLMSALNSKPYPGTVALWAPPSDELYDFQMVRGFHPRFVPMVPLDNLSILFYGHAVPRKIEPFK